MQIKASEHIVPPDKSQAEPSREKIQKVGSEDIPKITTDEIFNTIKITKNKKSARPDGKIPEMPKYVGPNLSTNSGKKSTCA